MRIFPFFLEFFFGGFEKFLDCILLKNGIIINQFFHEKNKQIQIPFQRQDVRVEPTFGLPNPTYPTFLVLLCQNLPTYTYPTFWYFKEASLLHINILENIKKLVRTYSIIAIKSLTKNIIIYLCFYYNIAISIIN